MANINAVPVVFEHGGIITIGSDTILNVEKGSMRFAPGIREVKEFTDRGVIQNPLEGDELPTDLEFDIKHTGGAGAAELFELMTAQPNPVTGYKKQYSIVVKFPDYSGATTGDQYTFAKCVPVSFEFQAGAQFDTAKLRFRDQESKPARASY